MTCFKWGVTPVAPDTHFKSLSAGDLTCKLIVYVNMNEFESLVMQNTAIALLVQLNPLPTNIKTCCDGQYWYPAMLPWSFLLCLCTCRANLLTNSSTLVFSSPALAVGVHTYSTSPMCCCVVPLHNCASRYPGDLDSFYQSRLDGTWNPVGDHSAELYFLIHRPWPLDSYTVSCSSWLLWCRFIALACHVLQDLAGKRMKLKVPETWETQVSSRGNKAEVWQDLIGNENWFNAHVSVEGHCYPCSAWKYILKVCSASTCLQMLAVSPMQHPSPLSFVVAVFCRCSWSSLWTLTQFEILLCNWPCHKCLCVSISLCYRNGAPSTLLYPCCSTRRLCSHFSHCCLDFFSWINETALFLNWLLYYGCFCPILWLDTETICLDWWLILLCYLADHNKLPFMAMLRNLRNMLQSNMDEKHHKWVLNKLTNRVRCGEPGCWVKLR